MEAGGVISAADFEVLDLADVALVAYRRGVDFVLAEYEKAFGARLE